MDYRSIRLSWIVEEISLIQRLQDV